MLNGDGRIDSDDERYVMKERGCREEHRIDLAVYQSCRTGVQIRSRTFHLSNSTESCYCCDCYVAVVDFVSHGFFSCKLAPLFHTEHLFESLNED